MFIVFENSPTQVKVQLGLHSPGTNWPQKWNAHLSLSKMQCKYALRVVGNVLNVPPCWNLPAHLQSWIHSHIHFICAGIFYHQHSLITNMWPPCRFWDGIFPRGLYYVPLLGIWISSKCSGATQSWNNHGNTIATLSLGTWILKGR